MFADETLIFHYDDARHFMHLLCAPYHKHFGDKDVIASEPPDLAAVLQEIEGLMAVNS
jgi:hypothetical protein